MYKIVRLGDVATIVGGNGFPKKYQSYKNKPIPFIKVSDMNTPGNEIKILSANNYVEDYELREFKAKSHPAGTLIFPKIGGAISTNKKRMLVSEAAFDNNVMGVIPDSDRILPEYLYKFFLSLDLYELSNKASLPSITSKRIRDLLLPIPSLSDQHQIVDKLDAVFTQIDALISILQKNKFNLKAFFNIQRNQIYKELLKNNRTIKLKEVVNLSRGYNPPKSKFISNPKEGYIRFYQIRDAKSDKYATYVPESKKLRKVFKNDLLMNAYRHIGEVFTNVEGAFNVALCKLSIKDTKILEKEFLYFMIPSYLIKGTLLKKSERSLIP